MGELMYVIKMKYYAKLGIITGTDPLDLMMADPLYGTGETENSGGLNLDPLIAEGGA